MALFSNKIETAKFVDHQEKTIEVLYKQTPESVTLSTYILELNYNSQDFLDLLEEVSIEQLQDNTREFYGNIHKNKSQSVHAAAEVMFTDWIANAQIDLDKQDEERYKLFEKYKEEQLSVLQSEVDAQVERRVSEGFKGVQAELDVQIEERYKEADEYKKQQLEILQNELDVQIEERYKEADTYREEQLSILQKEIDEQTQGRFKETDEYKEQQLEILQKEIDVQIENRFKEADEYKEQQLEILQKEIDEQTQGRFKEVEAYKEEQLSILQNELDAQIKNRYKEADAYKEEQLEILQKEINEQAESKHQEIEGMKNEFLKKFSITSPSPVVYSPEKVAKYIIDNFEDEDTIFKTKLEIFNLPEVKNSKNREMKMKVRKAKTVPEIFAAYYDIQHSNS